MSPTPHKHYAAMSSLSHSTTEQEVAQKYESAYALDSAIRSNEIRGVSNPEGYTPLSYGVSEDGQTWEVVERDSLWLWDCAEFHPLTLAHRLPVVNSYRPSYFYHVALCINGEDERDPFRGLEPTEQEIAQLTSYLEYFMTKMYHQGYIERLRERPVDIDSGVNTVTFIKRPVAGWGYSRRTWEQGPPIAPSFLSPEHYYASLLDLLDRVNDYGTGKPTKTWVEWKAARPEIF